MPTSDQPPVTPSPYLSIPYFAGDEGRPGTERPLTAAHPSWLCPSINVSGGPFFTPGADLSVKVTVANYGSGPQADVVNVIVYWAEPTTGFTTKNYLGQNAMYIPRSGVTGGPPVASPLITGLIPATVPNHICLLALVYAAGDTPAAGSPVDPVNDRHWAQMNLNAVNASKSGTFHFTFWAGNPLARGASFYVAARLVHSDLVGVLSRQLRAEPLIVEDARLTLQRMRILGVKQDESRPEADLNLELEANARQPLHIAGQLPHQPEPGHFVAVEVLQWHGSNEKEGKLVGSLGIIVVGPPR